MPSDDRKRTPGATVPLSGGRPVLCYIAIGWTLLGIGWFLNSVAAYVVTKAPEHEVLATGLVATVVLLLTVGLWQMRRFAIIAFAVTCLVLSAIQTLNAVGMLLTGGPHLRTAAILIYFIAPSVFLGMYCLQHDFLKKARAYRESRRTRDEVR